MRGFMSITTVLIVTGILMRTIRSESTSVKAHCFKVYNHYHNGCTGLSVLKASTIESIRDTCCPDNDTSGQEAGYAHLSQPMGYPGYFMCDRCPDDRNKTINNNNHHHHHQQQQQQQHHHLKKYHHKHHNYKKWKKSLKSEFQSTRASSLLAPKGNSGEDREWHMKQEKRKMKMTNKTKPDKISNSVISEETNDASRPTTRAEATTASNSPTTTQQQHKSTRGVASKAWQTTSTDVGTGTTKNHNHHHHHHHHHRHKHHRHGDRSIRRTTANDAEITSTATPAKVNSKLAERDDDWSSWSDWTPCFETKNVCMQRRTRYCLLASCPKTKGNDNQERICSDRDSKHRNCMQATTPASILARRRDKLLLGTARTTKKVATSSRRIASTQNSSRSSSTSRLTTSNKSTTNGSIDEGMKSSRKKVFQQKTFFGNRATSSKIAKDKSELLPTASDKIYERQYEWSAWQPCSASCGAGVQVRRRMCLIEHRRRTAKSDLKGNCSTSDVVENRPCVTKNCSVNGNWSEWKVAVNCTSSPCSGEAGVMTWSRTCTNPSPSLGGKSCQGREWKREICYNNSGCSGKVDGGWCPWKNWVKSSKGSVRLRTCECPPPVNGGKHCQGPSEQTLNDAMVSTSNKIQITTKKTQDFPFHECDESLGSGDGSEVSCDQENIEKKSQLNSLSRPKTRNNHDENYHDDDDDDDDDDVIVGSGDLK